MKWNKIFLNHTSNKGFILQKMQETHTPQEQNQNILTKNDYRTCIDIFARKTHKWSSGIWKDHHCWSWKIYTITTFGYHVFLDLFSCYSYKVPWWKQLKGEMVISPFKGTVQHVSGAWNSWLQHNQNKEPESDLYMLLLSSHYPFISPSILARERCHPQWWGLP